MPIANAERNYQKVFSQVLSKIKPTPDEQAEDKAFIDRFVKHVDALTPKEVKIQLAGSTCRGTNLRHDRDFDVFVLFPKTYSVAELEKLGLEWAKNAVGKSKWEIAYAEHPYLRAWVEGRELDLVPAYSITNVSERETAVDRSPLHAAYLSQRLTEAQKDDVRLLKQFLKAAGIYGAEGKIMGFSGYLCELLILAHGTFLKFMEDSAKARKTPVFDLEKPQAAAELEKKFPDSAMIFIDPVDPNRNVAAAVSKTSLSLLIHTARSFIEKPSTHFFFPQPRKVDSKWMKKQLGMRDSAIFIVEFDKPDIVEDILWPQLYKFMDKVSHRAQSHGFIVFDSDVAEKNGRCTVLFEFEVHSLPRLKKLLGPPLWLREEVESFIKKHNVTEPIWFEHDKILALGKRRFLLAKDFVKDVIGNPGAYGVPPDIEKAMKKKKARILDIKEAVKRYPEFLHAYLRKRNIP